MSDDPKSNQFFVKKAEVKKGKAWNDIANQRIHKQHHGGEIPEGDRHAIPKYVNPTVGTSLSPEETDKVVDKLESQIKVLQEKDKQIAPPKLPEAAPTVENDDWYD